MFINYMFSLISGVVIGFISMIILIIMKLKISNKAKEKEILKFIESEEFKNLDIEKQSCIKTISKICYSKKDDDKFEVEEFINFLKMNQKNNV